MTLKGLKIYAKSNMEDVLRGQKIVPMYKQSDIKVDLINTCKELKKEISDFIELFKSWEFIFNKDENKSDIPQLTQNDIEFIRERKAKIEAHMKWGNIKKKDLK